MGWRGPGGKRALVKGNDLGYTSGMIRTLADILAPMTPEQFFADYHDNQPLQTGCST